MRSSPRLLWPALVALALVLTGCASEAPAPTASRDDTVYQVASGSSPLRVVAVGDIACPADEPVTAITCQQGATAALARRLSPKLVLALGDLQYPGGALSDFTSGYDTSWGALKDVTRPAPGNHEYVDRGAAGYYSYFKGRQPGAPGYYRVSASGWNIYLLNSNCAKISCAAEAAWLNRQMAAHRSRCSLVTMHHPRYSSGSEHGSTTTVKQLWRVAYRHRNDVVLAGHDHDYERFQPMDAANHVRRRRGMVSFVVGTGGRSLYHLGTRKRGSAYFQNRAFGVLALDLKPGSYTWSYRATSGAQLDGGSRRCR